MQFKAVIILLFILTWIGIYRIRKDLIERIKYLGGEQEEIESDLSDLKEKIKASKKHKSK